MSLLIKEIKGQYNSNSDSRKLFVSRADYNESLRINKKCPQDFYFFRDFDVFIQIVYNKRTKKYQLYIDGYYCYLLNQYARSPSSEKSFIISNDFNSCYNLYTQFLYRIIQITQKYNCNNLYIGLFSPTAFLCGHGFKPFRQKFVNNYIFIDGIQFQASHFADVADSWGISFSIWKSGYNGEKHIFNYKLADIQNGEVVIIDNKNLYNADNLITGSDWENSLKINNTVEIIGCKSALSFNSIKKWNTFANIAERFCRLY